MKNLFAICLLCLLSFSACNSGNAEGGDAKAEVDATKTTATATQTGNATQQNNQNEQEKMDEEIIKKYIADNGLKAERDPSGVYYIIEKPGGAAKPTAQDQITAHYHGTLLDGTVFDSSVERGDPIVFPLGGVIKGWQIGIPKFGKGGKGKLIIPSSLAYGPRAQGKIPANSCLIFDVEVVDFLSKEDQEKKNKEMQAAQVQKDDDIIKKYIADNGLKAQKDESGLYYIVEKPGAEPFPKAENTVTVHYHGTLLDGTVFDSSVERGEPAVFPLNRVVPGWQIGIPKFGKGGKGRIILPSGLAYGARGAGPKIGPNTCLIFDVEVIDVK